MLFSTYKGIQNAHLVRKAGLARVITSGQNELDALQLQEGIKIGCCCNKLLGF